MDIDTQSIGESWRTLGSSPFSKGGIRLRSAFETSPAAYWASWADCLEMVHQRHPDVAESVLEKFNRNEGAAAACKTKLESVGCELPTWAECVAGKRPPKIESNNDDLGSFKHGWQHHAVSFMDSKRRSNIWDSFSTPEQAHIRSQSGRGAQPSFTALPTSTLTRIDSSGMRVLLLRRLRFHLPLVQRCCLCHHFLDPFGDHRCACSTSGFLSLRGFDLEVAMARVCREAGARVQTNKFLRDLSIDGILLTDGQRIEVITNGLSLFHGVEFAIDTTIVSALRRNGTAKPRNARADGVGLEQARHKKEKIPRVVRRRGAS